MPQFEYEVKKGPGPTTKGIIEAENQRAAVRPATWILSHRVEEYVAQSRRIPCATRWRIRIKDRNVMLRQLANF